VSAALLASEAALALTLLVALVWRMPEIADADREAVDRADPEVALALTGRSGPIILEIEYRIDAGEARAFYHRMQAVRAMRLRNGAFDSSISRDTEIRNIGSNAIISQPGSIICASAVAPRARNRRCTNRSRPIIAATPFCACAAFSNGRSDRCGERKRPPITAPAVAPRRPARG